MDPSKFAQNHMPVQWAEELLEPDTLAVNAPLEDKTSIVCHVGLIALASGTGSWRVRESMNQIARLLGIRCHVDVSLLGIECSCVQGKQRCTHVSTLRTTGVNTSRLWHLEDFVTEAAKTGAGLTVAQFHKKLSDIESEKGHYTAAELGLAAGFACGAFVFLLGGDLAEMLCAAVGAGFGNFTRMKLLGKRLNQMFSVAVSVAVSCLCYVAILALLEALLGTSDQNEAGYIGAMLFVIPGFPLITSGLDIAKLDMRSGFERFGYAFIVIAVATLTGWIVASVVGLAPGELTPLNLTPMQLLVLRLIMSFVGVYGFSVMFNSAPKMCATAASVGAIANTLRLELGDFGLVPEISTLFGALTAGLLAYVVIRNAGRLHLPTFPRISITVPSIVIMVPGLYMYRAMYYLALFNMTTALDWAFRAFMVIIFLPIGLALARIATDPRWRYCT